MKRHLSTRSLVRNRWFADLSTALDDGERVLAELIAEGCSPAETGRLRLRLIELRAELERLNRVSLSGGRVVGSAWPEGGAAMIDPPTSLHPDWLPRRD